MIKVLRGKDWIEITHDKIIDGDILHYYDKNDNIIIKQYGITEIHKIPEFYSEKENTFFNSEIIMLSDILSIEDSRKLIKSLIGKYASFFGRYKFKIVYKILYDFLESKNIEVRKRAKPHIDYLTKDELIMAEGYLRFCLHEDEVYFGEILEKYGLLADSNLLDK